MTALPAGPDQTERLPGNEQGEAFVFRDFEESQIERLRRFVRERTLIVTAGYLGVVASWTIIMTTAHGHSEGSGVLLNLTPHVAHFTLFLGLFFFPLRLIWIPVLTYMAVFLYPFITPISGGGPWFANPALDAGMFLALLGLNLLSGVLTALGCELAFRRLARGARPYFLDLTMCVSAVFIFVLACLVQLRLTLAWLDTLSEADLAALGITPDFIWHSMLRILRGGVVAGSFLLAAIDPPTRREFRRVALLALSYPLLGLAHLNGITLHPLFDAAMLGIALALVTQVNIGVAAVLSGISIYIAMTGHFLNDAVGASADERRLVLASTLLLFLFMLIAILRSRTRHVFREKDSAIARLDRLRALAGVGTYAVNLATRSYRMDEAGQTLLVCPPEGPLEWALANIDPGSIPPILDAMEKAEGSGIPHLFQTRLAAAPEHAEGLAGLQRMVTIFIWYERSPAGDPLAFGLVLDSTKEFARNRRLSLALSELSERQAFQSQLFSIISHELRTPASVLAMLIDDMPEAQDKPAALRRMKDVSDHLLSVLTDMRQAVNPEKNLPIERVPYAPQSLAESLLNTLDLPAREKGISIVLNMGPGAPQPRVGDLRRVKQALINLVKNAIIHSGARTIIVTWRSEVSDDPDAPPQSVWKVEDDGRGIQPEDLDRLFQPFQRGAGGGRQRADGTGLGLYIARSSIELLDGTLKHFQPPRGGTGFILRLPEPRATEADLAPLAEPSRPEAPAQPCPRGPIRILLAEDNKLVAEVMKARLERQFGTVTLAENGREALRVALETRPDLVITDLFMPELDGDDLTRRLRARGFDKPIIGVSAAAVETEMHRFLDAGANAVMQKPLDTAQLAQMLDRGFQAPQVAGG